MLCLWREWDKRKKALDWEGQGTRVLIPSLPPSDVRIWTGLLFSLELSYVIVKWEGWRRFLRFLPALITYHAVSKSPVSLTKDADEQVKKMNIQDLLPEGLRVEVNTRLYYFNGENFPHLYRSSRSEYLWLKTSLIPDRLDYSSIKKS